MRKGMSVTMSVFLLVLSANAAQNTLACVTLNDGIEKIKCTFVTGRKNVDRNVTFYWHSGMHPQDDRERTLTLPAFHGSVYDYRHLWGRAQGLWSVTATVNDIDGTQLDTLYVFHLEDGNITKVDQ